MTRHGTRAQRVRTGAGDATPAWVHKALEALAAAGREESDTLRPVLCSSPALSAWVAQDPRLAGAPGGRSWVAEQGRTDYLRRLESLRGEASGRDDFCRSLRLERRRQMVRIVAREVLGVAPVAVTARELAAFAESAVECALRWARAAAARRFGEPLGTDGDPIPLCVLGMGKLGGRELNLSSDVDLVFLYGSGQGHTQGGEEGGVEPRRFFAHIVSEVADLLGRVSAEGLVFRVDLDLRPEGRNGEPALPVEAALLYYESWGQTWERAMLTKARPIAGDLELGAEFLREIEPFVFRRSLDYTTVEDIKEMKRRLDQHAARRLGRSDDLKLGRGGIREVEFFVQTLQLIHGGKLPAVREQNTVRALERLARQPLAEAAAAAGLKGCYLFLRRLEHAVQALHFRQTHRLPGSPEELQAVARRLGYPAGGGVARLLRELDAVRARVHATYSRLVHGAAQTWEGQAADWSAARAVLALEAGDPEAKAVLRQAGFRDPDRALEGLRLLREGRRRAAPSPRASKILGRIAPFLLDAVAGAPDPDRALVHLGEFLSASGARASYLSLLEENPATARLLVTLFGTSDFLSRYLVNHPELLDELVLGIHGVRAKTAAEMQAELAAAVARCRDDDEDRLEALRRFRNSEFIRIALNDLWGALSPDEVGAQITGVAEVCLQEVCSQALARLTEKYGTPREEGGGPARFAILGMGKLGGRGLDYHSDLDVVFVYSAGGATRPRGGRSGISSAEFFARLAQRVMSALTARTREGIVFRMDARLRPSGQAGPLVTSLDAFAAYHRGESQTWEKLALVRLRAVAGDREFGRQVEQLAAEVAFGGRSERSLRREIGRMRRRIEEEVGREAGTQLDLKAGAGGILDVEFAVQTLQLEHGGRIERLRAPSTLEALREARECGLIADRDSRALEEGYRFLRRVEAKLRILLERPTDTLPADSVRLEQLAQALGYVGEDAAERLLEEVRLHKRRVRRAYRAVIPGGPES